MKKLIMKAMTGSFIDWSLTESVIGKFLGFEERKVKGITKKFAAFEVPKSDSFKDGLLLLSNVIIIRTLEDNMSEISTDEKASLIGCYILFEKTGSIKTEKGKCHLFNIEVVDDEDIELEPKLHIFKLKVNPDSKKNK